MQRIQANGIELAIETFGSSEDPPLILIMGFASQMVYWPDELCEQLAAAGHHVIRFDNRDIGLSTRMDDLVTPDLGAALLASQQGQALDAPYSVDDMADDTAALIEALGLQSAHVCGASMGGMIAQTTAIRHPQRVRTLVSIMSTTGEPDLPQAAPEVTQTLLQPAPLDDRDAYLAHAVGVWRVLGSRGFPFDEAGIRERAGRAFDRGIYPAGIVRQLLAILAHGSRRPGLEKLQVPALVIHGTDDPLVPLAGGRDTADAIPGARLLMIDGMGHDLPRGAWDRIVAAIAVVTGVGATAPAALEVSAPD